MLNFDLIKEYLEKNVVDSLSVIIESDDINEINKAAAVVSESFGSGSVFDISTEENEKKLITSIRNNISLLVQKTWIEEFDAMLKEQVIYKLDQFVTLIEKKDFTASYAPFFQILNDVVYLMFGSQAKSDDFAEYALRIDPEFGNFWCLVKSLPEKNSWSDEKSHVVQLLGMFFLANY